MRIIARAIALAVAAVLLAPAAAAAVSVDVDILWAPDPDSDTQVYLHASSLAYPLPRARVVSVFNQLGDPYADYPVLAFIAYHGHVDIGAVWSYRRRGHDWADVMFHFGVRPSVLFVELPRDPGPPYGKAYGHWRKHRNKMRVEQFGDDDVRYWVGLHTVAAYAGVPVARAHEWRRSGQRFEQIAGKQYREKHKGNRPVIQEAGFGPGKGQGKARKKNKH